MLGDWLDQQTAAKGRLQALEILAVGLSTAGRRQVPDFDKRMDVAMKFYREGMSVTEWRRASMGRPQRSLGCCGGGGGWHRRIHGNRVDMGPAAHDKWVRCAALRCSDAPPQHVLKRLTTVGQSEEGG